MKNGSIILLLVASQISFSCINEQEDLPVSKLNSIEDAKKIALSLDTLVKRVLFEVNLHDYGVAVYKLEFHLEGLNSGIVFLNGTDSTYSSTGHTFAYGSKKGSFNFFLDDFSWMDSVTLENEGSIDFNELNTVSRSFGDTGVNAERVVDTLELSSPSLKVLIRTKNGRIEDMVNIRFLYTYYYEIQEGVVTDSTYNYHYQITTPDGQFFEW